MDIVDLLFHHLFQVFEVVTHDARSKFAFAHKFVLDPFDLVALEFT